MLILKTLVDVARDTYNGINHTNSNGGNRQDRSTPSCWLTGKPVFRVLLANSILLTVKVELYIYTILYHVIELYTQLE